MKISGLSAALFISSALLACSSTPPTPLSDQKQIDQTVRQAVEKNNVIEESVLRDGGTVSLAVQLPESGKKMVGELYLRVDCASGRADFIFADILDRRAVPAKKERRYADGTSLYSSPFALSESTSRDVHRLDAVKKACERTPSWREIAYNKRTEAQLLLEVSSLQTQEDGSVRFWAAVDYPNIAYIRTYKAPYARRAAFYQVDCQKQSYSLLHVYYLDQQQTITDGGMQTRPPVLKIPQATGDSATVLSAICSQEDLAQTLLPPEPRGKRLPNFSDLPDMDANIAGQLAQRRTPPPRQPLSSIRVEGTRTFLSGSAAARLNKPGFFRQEIFIEPESTPGVFRVTFQEGDNRTEQISFLGMIAVSQMLYSTDEQSVFEADRLELRGDWEKVPVYGQLGYSKRIRVTNLMTNQSTRNVEVICKVIREIAAADLHARFQGRAKELNCHVIGDKIDEITTYYYLENYGFGFPLGSKSAKYSLDLRVTGVQQ